MERLCEDWVPVKHHLLQFGLYVGMVAALCAIAACARDTAIAPVDAGSDTVFADAPDAIGEDSTPADIPETLRPDTGSPTQCTRVGDPCLLPDAQDVQVQNDEYVCIRNSGGEGDCHIRCRNPHDPDECRGVGGWCLDIGTDEPLPACLFDECALSGDCGPEGVCLRFRRQVGLCFFGGTAGKGEYCDFTGDPSSGCSGGLVCDDFDSVCRATCDPWGRETCTDGTVCGLFTNWTGACWPQSDTGRDPFEPCSPRNEYCGTNLLCAQIDPPPATPNCIPICQLEEPDSCAAYRAGEFNTQCYEAFDDGVGGTDTEVGFCLP